MTKSIAERALSILAAVALLATLFLGVVPLMASAATLANGWKYVWSAGQTEEAVAPTVTVTDLGNGQTQIAGNSDARIWKGGVEKDTIVPQKNGKLVFDLCLKSKASKGRVRVFLSGGATYPNNNHLDGPKNEGLLFIIDESGNLSFNRQTGTAAQYQVNVGAVAMNHIEIEAKGTTSEGKYKVKVTVNCTYSQEYTMDSDFFALNGKAGYMTVAGANEFSLLVNQNPAEDWMYAPRGDQKKAFLDVATTDLGDGKTKIVGGSSAREWMGGVITDAIVPQKNGKLAFDLDLQSIGSNPNSEVRVFLSGGPAYRSDDSNNNTNAIYSPANGGLMFITDKNGNFSFEHHTGSASQYNVNVGATLKNHIEIEARGTTPEGKYKVKVTVNCKVSQEYTMDSDFFALNGKAGCMTVAGNYDFSLVVNENAWLSADPANGWVPISSNDASYLERVTANMTATDLGDGKTRLESTGTVKAWMGGLQTNAIVPTANGRLVYDFYVGAGTTDRCYLYAVLDNESIFAPNQSITTEAGGLRFCFHFADSKKAIYIKNNDNKSEPEITYSLGDSVTDRTYRLEVAAIGKEGGKYKVQVYIDGVQLLKKDGEPVEYTMDSEFFAFDSTKNIPGYMAVGSQLEAGGDKFDVTVAPAKAATLTLKNGNETVKTVDYLVGDKMDLADVAVPTKANSYFTGWFTDPAGETPVANNTEIKGNTTVYAGWQVAAAEVLKIEGVQVRLGGKQGMRYISVLDAATLNNLKSSVTNVTYGTLLQLAENADAAFEYKNVGTSIAKGDKVAVEAKVNFTETNEEIRYTAVIVGMPGNYYGTDIAARAYLKYTDASGIERVYYSSEDATTYYATNLKAAAQATKTEWADSLTEAQEQQLNDIINYGL